MPTVRLPEESEHSEMVRKIDSILREITGAGDIQSTRAQGLRPSSGHRVRQERRVLDRAAARAGHVVTARLGALFVASALALSACGLITVVPARTADPWPAWTATMSEATALIETTLLPARPPAPVFPGGFTVPVATASNAPDLAEIAASLLVRAIPPPGASGYRDEFVRLYTRRAELGREPAPSLAPGGLVRCALQPNGADCISLRAAQDAQRAGLIAWNDELVSLRRRYEAWLATQAR